MHNRKSGMFVYLFSEASEASGADSLMSSRYIYIYIWRASVASETLTGVTQSKIGDVSLLASERSERDTYRGNTIENRGC